MKKSKVLNNMNINNSFHIKKEQLYGDYLVINTIYKTKNGELLLVKNNNKKNCEGDEAYLLNKIKIINETEKLKLEKEIDILSQINSKYIMKIIKHFIIQEEEKNSFVSFYIIIEIIYLI